MHFITSISNCYLSWDDFHLATASRSTHLREHPFGHHLSHFFCP